MIENKFSVSREEIFRYEIRQDNLGPLICCLGIGFNEKRSCFSFREGFKGKFVSPGVFAHPSFAERYYNDKLESEFESLCTDREGKPLVHLYVDDNRRVEGEVIFYHAVDKTGYE